MLTGIHDRKKETIAFRWCMRDVRPAEVYVSDAEELGALFSSPPPPRELVAGVGSTVGDS
jgi:hypothetical protein